MDSPVTFESVAGRCSGANGRARPWLFPAFEDAIAACLATDPVGRPTAKELATSLA